MVKQSSSRDFYQALRGNARIDIIIPFHNDRATLARALASVAMQTIAEDVDVTLVDDSSDDSCEDILKAFSHLISLRVLHAPSPSGYPGRARAFALERTSNAFVAFIDADDTLADAFSLARLFSVVLTCPACHVACGAFAAVVNEWAGTQFIAHRDDHIHVFAKLYRRSFLEENGLSFPTELSCAKYNEDYGFNAPIFLCFQENTLFIPEIVYHWHESPDSLTRSADPAAFLAQMDGLANNMIFAFEKCRALSAQGKAHLTPDALVLSAPYCLLRLFKAYCQAQEQGAGAPSLLSSAQQFYRHAFLPLCAEASPQAVMQATLRVRELCGASGGNAERTQAFDAFWASLPPDGQAC